MISVFQKRAQLTRSVFPFSLFWLLSRLRRRKIFRGETAFESLEALSEVSEFVLSCRTARGRRRGWITPSLWSLSFRTGTWPLNESMVALLTIGPTDWWSPTGASSRYGVICWFRGATCWEDEFPLSGDNCCESGRPLA